MLNGEAATAVKFVYDFVILLESGYAGEKLELLDTEDFNDVGILAVEHASSGWRSWWWLLVVLSLGISISSIILGFLAELLKKLVMTLTTVLLVFHSLTGFDSFLHEFSCH